MTCTQSPSVLGSLETKPKGKRPLRPSRHLGLSAAAGGAVWATTGEPWALPISVATGVLVDLDHGPDLWWAFALRREPIATFVLHGWEWLLGLVVLGLFMGFPWALSAALVGYGLHLITDQMFNNGGLWSYSLVYRARHRFRAAELAPDWDFDHAYEVLRSEVPFATATIEWWRGRHRSTEK